MSMSNAANGRRSPPGGGGRPNSNGGRRPQGDRYVPAPTSRRRDDRRGRARAGPGAEGAGGTANSGNGNSRHNHRDRSWRPVTRSNTAGGVGSRPSPAGNKSRSSPPPSACQNTPSGGHSSRTRRGNRPPKPGKGNRQSAPSNAPFPPGHTMNHDYTPQRDLNLPKNPYPFVGSGEPPPEGTHLPAFTFQSSIPAPNFPSHAPRGPRAERGQGGLGNRPNNIRRNGGRDGGQRYRPPATHDRAIIRIGTGTLRQKTPERLEGMGNGPSRFRPLDELSDSDQEMDMSEGESGVDEHQAKRLRLQDATPPDSDSRPKWSNPDPYSVLPPVEEPRAKRKDVVQLIRKAKVVNNANTEVQANAVSKNDDFIPFDFGSDEEGEVTENESVNTAAVAPTAAPVISPATAPTLRWTPQGVQVLDQPPTARIVPVPEAPKSASSAPSFRLPPKPAAQNGMSQIRQDNNVKSALGSYDEENAAAQAAEQAKKQREPKKRKRMDAMSMESRWLQLNHSNATPWNVIDRSGDRIDLWLHNEIKDYYEFVKPRDFEHRAREDLISRISRAVRSVRGKIDCFGSFPAGLYLPAADMDLVFVTDEYERTGTPGMVLKYKPMRKFLNHLIRARICDEHDYQIITKAKVPIVKFVDIPTGLNVDISFDNLTGVEANSTYRRWKEEFPVMPVLVALVKQLLIMRSLSEVFMGGMGGFAVTCLVVSMLQNHPGIQSGSIVPEENLGALFLDFLDLYGNKFDLPNTGIRLKPPEYFTKDTRNNKFHIVDPNNPHNDISKGTTEALCIKEVFSSCHRALKERMAMLTQSSPTMRKGQSILNCVLGGNYNSYLNQRAKLSAAAMP